jgi:hypothetical protein
MLKTGSPRGCVVFVSSKNQPQLYCNQAEDLDLQQGARRGNGSVEVRHLCNYIGAGITQTQSSKLRGTVHGSNAGPVPLNGAQCNYLRPL